MQAIDARIEMINGNFDLPETVPTAMKRVREILAKAAADLKTVVEKEEINVGCMITAMDLLQHAKNKACDAMILPHYKNNKE